MKARYDDSSTPAMSTTPSDRAHAFESDCLLADGMCVLGKAMRRSVHDGAELDTCVDVILELTLDVCWVQVPRPRTGTGRHGGGQRCGGTGEGISDLKVPGGRVWTSLRRRGRSGTQGEESTK
ncbi:7369_t:CDS:2 [Paraglomus occultum]|uniref:7369_t:CDS:1 n=1 Tax=Paraglomus occultum TaxID=144539 RepID=A0A9N9GPH7_9GLOM|nr:7369_t:CDS:2 [Paraglomus occultum]